MKKKSIFAENCQSLLVLVSPQSTDLDQTVRLFTIIQHRKLIDQSHSTICTYAILVHSSSMSNFSFKFFFLKFAWHIFQIPTNC